MRTLVIHPFDPSTHFLCDIYRPIPTVTVVSGQIPKEEVAKLIAKHDRTIMLGHGGFNGLFGINFDAQYIIDENTVPLLQKQTNNVYIWCHASAFVEKHDLHGLYSGMFISEVSEAKYCSIFTDSVELATATQTQVWESNIVFSRILGLALRFNSLTQTYNELIDNYTILSEKNPIAKYNCELLKQR